MAHDPQLEEQFADWLEEARAGSQEALGEILEACRGYLLSIANRELDADVQAKAGASDLVQGSFLRARQKFEGFRGDTEGELRAWLRRILLNDTANLRRHFRATDKRQVSRELSLEAGSSLAFPRQEVYADTPSPSSMFARDEQSLDLTRALARLPENYRQVIVQRYWKHQSFKQIGADMGRSANAVRKLWLRAIERLHLEWERLDDDRG